MPTPSHCAAPGPILRASMAALRARCRSVLADARTGLAAALLVCVTAGTAANAVQPPRQASRTASASTLEYAVKATYLYKLAPFVNWPPGGFASANAPFRICVVGDNPFDGFLENAVDGRRLGAHPFEVLRLDALTAEAGCQIAFISHLSTQTTTQALDAVNGKPVLTVMDSAVPDREGIVQFVIQRGRVGFEINAAAAARNQLTISSKLLSLALVVRNPS